MARHLILALAVLSPAVATTAQAPPAFDVVSIKRQADPQFGPIQWTPGRFVARAPLSGLINVAWGTALRLEGGPSWARTAVWDIVATWEASRIVTAEERGAMLRAMLEDRFKLVLRREVREAPVYALVMARRDGRPGSGLQRADQPCDAPGRPRFAAHLPEPGQRPACGLITIVDQNAVIGGNTPMERFARVLGSLVQRDVVDRTGLTGEFDIVLRFAWDNAIRPNPFPPADRAQLAPPSEFPNIFTAVQEQLGLRLESTRAPLDYHVVERAELPAEN
jgi:uncharacterized protein (TIGR03435 family)